MSVSKLTLMATPGASPDTCIEPFLSSGTPEIVGTIQRGKKIEVDVSTSTWVGDENGGKIRFSIELYSYSNTLGDDEKLEKTRNSTKGIIEVLLKGPDIVGRYLRARVSAENDCGSNPYEVYWTDYTATVSSGTDPTLESYNALFGRGVHLQDNNLQAHWEMQESSGSPTSLGVFDSSINSKTGSLLGYFTDDYADYTDTDGPTSYLPRSLGLDGGEDYFLWPNESSFKPTASGTFGMWLKPLRNDMAYASLYAPNIYAGGVGTDGVAFFLTGAGNENKPRIEVSTSQANRESLVYSTALSSGNWYHLCSSFNGSILEITVDGTSETGAQTITPDPWNSRPYTGPALDFNDGLYDYINGRIAGLGVFNRSLNTSEKQEWYNGPEPINVIPPSFTGNEVPGQTLSAVSGTWDSQSNGTVTVSYIWYRSDDTNGTNKTQVGTGATYDLVDGDAGKYITVVERGTNNGGFDEAEDTESAYSGAIRTVISKSFGIALDSFQSITATSTLAEDTLLSVSAIHEIPVVNAGGIQKVSAILLEFGSSLTNIASITIPIETTYRSHNKIFGLGNHIVPHPELRGYWPMQETSGTTVYDISGNDEHLTLSGMAGTDPNVTTGPTTYLPSAFEFWPQSKVPNGNPVIDKVQGTLPAGFDNLDYFTIGGWANYYFYPSELGRLIECGNNDLLLLSASNGFPTLSVEGEAAISPNSYDNAFNQWHFVIGRMNTSEFSVYFNDGDDVSNSNVNTFVAAANTFCIGNRLSGDRCHDGGLAGMFIISDYISDQELQEIKAGPEPYLQSGSVTITGTIARGELITLNAGTWNSQNNGVITYTYQLYSYSDTNGNNERLEKEIVTTITSRQVLLNDNIVEGRYLRVKVTAENDGGVDLLETYYSAYTSVVSSGSDYIVNDSYNALFGRGKHLKDKELGAHWEMLDDTNNTLVLDSSLNDNHGTLLAAAGNTENASFPGVGDWRSKSLYLDGNLDTIDFESFADNLPGFTFCIKVYPTANTIPMDWFGKWDGRPNPGTTKQFYSRDTTAQSYIRKFDDISEGVNATAGANVIQNTWNQIALVHDGINLYSSVDGNFGAGATAPWNSIPATDDKWSIGWAHQLQSLKGYVAESFCFTRALSSLELGEADLGPEPLNLIAPSAPSGTAETGATLTADTGFWDTQSNGSLTYSYQWTRSDDTLGTNETVVGTDSPTYTLVIGDLNKYIRCRIRASNDGGYDSLEDTFSAFTSQIELGTFPVSRSLSVALDNLLEIEANNDSTVELLESVERSSGIPNSFSASINSLKNILASFYGNITNEKDIIIDTLLSVDNTHTISIGNLQSIASTNQIPVSLSGQFTVSNQVIVVDTLQQINSIQTLPISSLQLISADKEIPFDWIGSFLVDRTLPISTFGNIQTFNEVPIGWLLSVQKTDEIPVSILQNIQFLSDILIDSSSNLLALNTLILEYLKTYEYTGPSYIWTFRPRYRSWPIEFTSQIWTFDTRDKIWSFGSKQRIWCIINRERVWIQLKKK